MQKRFSLIELLIVVAILAILMSLLQPSISKTLTSANTAKCLSQKRHLMVGVELFSEDHQGRYPSPDDNISRDPLNWIDDHSYASDKNTDAAIKRGALFAYTQDTSIYSCPEDDRHAVSYQMSSLIGQHRINNGQRATTVNQMERPQYRMVFVEEDSWRTVAIGSWAIHASTRYPEQNLGRWWDDVAIWHNNGMNVSFADGHVEHWQWEDPRTYSSDRLSPNGLGTTWHMSHPGSVDVDKTRRAYLGLEF